MSIAVAAIQFKPQASVDANLHCAATFLRQAGEAGCQLAVLPENFAYYGQADLLQAGRAESDEQGPVRQFLAEQAARHGIWLVAGTVPVAGPSPRPSARCFLLSPEGEVVDHYDKIHLFDVDVTVDGYNRSYRESDDYSAGKRVAAVRTDLAVLGLTVCYDLRFAELYRRLVDAEAQIITVPAAFTAATGKDHWQVLLRARAIENQCFVIGANLVDREHKRRGLWGGSCIIDPWGNMLASMEDEVGAVIAEIDLGKIDQIRAEMPVAEHRRL